MERTKADELHTEADKLIRAMYTGKVGWSARERACDLKLRAAFATLSDQTEAVSAFHRLLYGVMGREQWTAMELLLPALGPHAGNTILDALMHLARFQESWLREPEEWQDYALDGRAQIGSLARHLFGRYTLPPFLDAAWLMGRGEQAEEYRHWFVHLGQGGKLEAIRFPMPMTHRAAHYFLLAPAHYSLPAALRYGQVRALGGSETLANTLSESFLTELQSDEAFWFSVVTFFVNHPNIPTNQVEPILDFLKFRKFGTSGDDAPEPGFTMKGRTTDSLLKRMEEWHETLARLGKKSRQTWESSGIAPLDKTEKDKLSAATCHWRVVELTDTLSLAEEGREMRHCVRSYQDGCLKGRCSIWSLRLTLSDNPALRRLLTIEVNNQRYSIVQVRGKCNQTLSAMRGNHRMMLAKQILREWANQQHLGIACSI